MTVINLYKILLKKKKYNHKKYKNDKNMPYFSLGPFKNVMVFFSKFFFQFFIIENIMSLQL